MVETQQSSRLTTSYVVEGLGLVEGVYLKVLHLGVNANILPSLHAKLSLIHSMSKAYRQHTRPV
jgi:hypothetical protein